MNTWTQLGFSRLIKDSKKPLLRIWRSNTLWMRFLFSSRGTKWFSGGFLYHAIKKKTPGGWAPSLSSDLPYLRFCIGDCIQLKFIYWSLLLVTIYCKVGLSYMFLIPKIALLVINSCAFETGLWICWVKKSCMSFGFLKTLSSGSVIT